MKKLLASIKNIAANLNNPVGFLATVQYNWGCPCCDCWHDGEEIAVWFDSIEDVQSYIAEGFKPDPYKAVLELARIEYGELVEEIDVSYSYSKHRMLHVTLTSTSLGKFTYHQYGNGTMYWEAL